MTRPAGRYWDSCEDLDRSTIESSSLKWRDVSLYTCFYPPFHIHKVHMCVKDTRNIKMKKKKKANIRTNDRWYCCCLFIYLFLVFLLLLFPYSICPLFIFYFYYFFFFFTSLKMCNKSRLLRHGQVSELGTGLPSFSSASNVGLFVTRLNDQPRPRL